MAKPITQVNYETLMRIAKDFHQESEEITQVQRTLNQKIGELQNNWVGRAANAFFAEMESELLPATERLARALLTSEATLGQITKTFHEADMETASYYKDLDGEPIGASNGKAPGRARMATPGSAPRQDDDPNYDRFDTALEYMYDEMIKNAQSDEVDRIRYHLDVAFNPRKYWYLALGDPSYTSTHLMLALETWALQVHGNAPIMGSGPWDHKPILDDMLGLAGDPNNPKDDDYYFPIRGDSEHEYYYDIWSNIHYGYVGTAAGFDAETLQSGAALGDSFTGTNDAADELSVQIGIELWEKYGTDLTPEQLHQAILDHTDDYLELQEQDENISVVIEGRNFQ